MGRIEKEIATDSPALRELVQWLRDRRTAACLTYRELADLTGLHATTLQRVASGRTVPMLKRVMAYARGCNARGDEAHRLWLRARRERARADGSARPVPSPALVGDLAELSAALRGLYEEAGGPSLRVMEERAGSFGSLPRSAAHRIVSKQSVPRDLKQLQAFLRACDLPESRWKPWESAWSRAWRAEKQEHGVWFDGNWPAELPDEIQPRTLRPLVPGPRSVRTGVVAAVDLSQYEDPGRRVALPVRTRSPRSTEARSFRKGRAGRPFYRLPVEPVLFDLPQSDEQPHQQAIQFEPDEPQLRLLF
ncbi:helix-turn-helix domain-containing protein [Streptomyces sp. SID8374]|uniref:helix-turn-helix domain-containing protein n=1 Tax=Streptomyces sp. SID8374 TaxID=2690354 RepID=UPI00136E6787|nr:helix-turn-helix transcriptional regulator [Streptomyces sp. SID8374]MYX18412.1 helix-turn-helix domain-containing protein [Streptomyces sp. SID8374]